MPGGCGIGVEENGPVGGTAPRSPHLRPEQPCDVRPGISLHGQTDGRVGWTLYRRQKAGSGSRPRAHLAPRCPRPLPQRSRLPCWPGPLRAEKGRHGRQGEAFLLAGRLSESERGLGLGTLLAGPTRQPAVPMTETTPRADRGPATSLFGPHKGQALRAGGEACTCLPRGLPLPHAQGGPRRRGSHRSLPRPSLRQEEESLAGREGRLPTGGQRPRLSSARQCRHERRSSLRLASSARLGHRCPAAERPPRWHLPPTMGPAFRPLTCHPDVRCVRCVVRRVKLERPQCSLVSAASPAPCERSTQGLRSGAGGGLALSEAHVVLSARI